MDVSIESEVQDKELPDGIIVNGESKQSEEGAHDGSETHRKVDAALQAWNLVDLDSLKEELEKAATSLTPYAEKTQESRAAVVEKTKEVRKRHKELLNSHPEIKSLLKGYQTFIDHLTSHNSILRSAFFQAYDPLSRAPDPYKRFLEFEHAIIDSESSRIDATFENERLQRSISDLTQQLAERERQRDEVRELLKESQEAQHSKVQEVEKLWKAVLDEKKDNWEAREYTLESKVENQERLLNELKANYEVSQRLGDGESRDGDNQAAATSAAELDLAHSELERASSRLVDLEVRNEQLRQQLVEATSHNHLANRAENNEEEERLRIDNMKLLRKVDEMQADRTREERKRSKHVQEYQGTMHKLQQEHEVLRQKLKKRDDYEMIQSELKALKAVEFSSFDDDETRSEADANPKESGNVRSSQANNLEQLLVAKNQRLNSDMAELRVAYKELTERFDELTQGHRQTVSDLESSQVANTTLESDLVKIQREMANGLDTSGMSVAGTYTSRNLATSFKGRRGRTSPTSSIISGFDPASTSRTNLDALRAGDPVGGGSGILPMIQAQRDRFKQKNSQLEEEMSKQHDMISSLRQEVSSLQKDNLSLYEKTRYVSTYNRGHQASSASTYSRSPQGASVQSSSEPLSDLGSDHRYRSAYEANISPFAQFRGREATRAYKRMSLPERIIFSITRMVLANRTSRNLFAGYCMALHMLIFVMLYWMTAADHSQHASHLGDSTAVGAGVVGAIAGADSQHGDWQQEGFHADAT